MWRDLRAGDLRPVSGWTVIRLVGWAIAETVIVFSITSALKLYVALKRDRGRRDEA